MLDRRDVLRFLDWDDSAAIVESLARWRRFISLRAALESTGVGPDGVCITELIALLRPLQPASVNRFLSSPRIHAASRATPLNARSMHSVEMAAVAFAAGLRDARMVRPIAPGRYHLALGTYAVVLTLDRPGKVTVEVEGGFFRCLLDAPTRQTSVEAGTDGPPTCSPGTLVLLRRHGTSIPFLDDYDPSLRHLFKDGTEPVELGHAVREQVLAGLLQAWQNVSRAAPNVAAEMGALDHAFVPIRDASDPSVLRSYSTPLLPGALNFTMVDAKGAPFPWWELADAWVHEHLHNKLYLLDEACPMFAGRKRQYSSPWKSQERPIDGILHAAFVFSHLQRFWSRALEGLDGPAARYAESQAIRHRDRISKVIPTLEASDELAESGRLVLRSCVD